MAYSSFLSAGLMVGMTQGLCASAHLQKTGQVLSPDSGCWEDDPNSTQMYRLSPDSLILLFMRTMLSGREYIVACLTSVAGII